MSNQALTYLSGTTGRLAPAASGKVSELSQLTPSFRHGPKSRTRSAYGHWSKTSKSLVYASESLAVLRRVSLGTLATDLSAATYAGARLFHSQRNPTRCRTMKTAN